MHTYAVEVISCFCALHREKYSPILQQKSKLNLNTLPFKQHFAWLYFPFLNDLFPYCLYSEWNIKSPECTLMTSLNIYTKILFKKHPSLYLPPDPTVSSLLLERGEPGWEMSSLVAFPTGDSLRAPLARRRRLFGCLVWRWCSNASWVEAVRPHSSQTYSLLRRSL